MQHYIENSTGMSMADYLILLQERIKNNTTYHGVKSLRNPFDGWVYQEILFNMRPDVIIEIGNAYGASLLQMAHFCDIIGKGRIIGVDITHERIAPSVSSHKRISLITGDACASYDKVKNMIDPAEDVLIIEDSSHTYENTLNVLRAYNSLIKENGLFIVEDSICHHGLQTGPCPGPFEAIETFTAENQSFISDRTFESFIITWNPKGFLRRSGRNKVQPEAGFSKAIERKKRNQSKISLLDFVPPVAIKLLHQLKPRPSQPG